MSVSLLQLQVSEGPGGGKKPHATHLESRHRGYMNRATLLYTTLTTGTVGETNAGAEPLAVLFANPVCAAGRRDDDATCLLNASRLVGSLRLVILQPVRSFSPTALGTSRSLGQADRLAPTEEHGPAVPAVCHEEFCAATGFAAFRFFGALPLIRTALVFDIAKSPNLLPTPSGESMQTMQNCRPNVESRVETGS